MYYFYKFFNFFFLFEVKRNYCIKVLLIQCMIYWYASHFVFKIILLFSPALYAYIFRTGSYSWKYLFIYNLPQGIFPSLCTFLPTHLHLKNGSFFLFPFFLETFKGFIIIHNYHSGIYISHFITLPGGGGIYFFLVLGGKYDEMGKKRKEKRENKERKGEKWFFGKIYNPAPVFCIYFSVFNMKIIFLCSKLSKL